MKGWEKSFYGVVVYFHFTYRRYSFTLRNFTTRIVNTEIFKSRSIALVHIRLWIYFWDSWLTEDRAPQIVQCPDETVQISISKSLEFHKRNPMSIISITNPFSYPHLLITGIFPGKFTIFTFVNLRFLLRRFTHFRQVWLLLKNRWNPYL